MRLMDDASGAWQGSEWPLAGEHRPATHTSAAMDVVAALFWAFWPALFVDTFVFYNNQNYDTGAGPSVAVRVAVTASAAAAVGVVRVCLTWRRPDGDLVWDRGGVAYRSSRTGQSVIAWREVTSVQAAPGESGEVTIASIDPETGAVVEIVIGTAGKRPGRRWSLWSHSQQGLIDAIEAARAVALSTSYVSPPPLLPPPRRFPTVVIPIWLVVALMLAAGLVAADQTSWFDKLLSSG